MISEEFEARLSKANAELKAGNFGVRLEVRGKARPMFSVRGTFPPRPDSDKTVPHQQRISLGIPARVDTIKAALQEARKIGFDVGQGTFDWRKFSDYEDPNARGAKAWCEAYEAQYWATHDQNNRHHRATWNCYVKPLTQLAENGDAPLTADLLVQFVTDCSQPCTNRRVHYCTVARRIAELAGIELPRSFDRLCAIGAVTPKQRKLLGDEELIAIGKQIKHPGWQQVYWLLLAYGFRPHELYGLDWGGFPLLRTHPTTKTGARIVVPVRWEWHEWIDRDRLAETGYDWDVPQSGRLIANWFYDHMHFPAYNLRHCYRGRLVRSGIPPEVESRIMGHSVAMGQTVYLQHFDQSWWVQQAMQLLKPG